MIIILHVLCSAISGGRGWDQTPSISSPYNKSFLLCHHLPIQYIIHSPTSSITMSFTPSIPFPNSNITLPSLNTLPCSSSHSSAPSILSSHMYPPIPFTHHQKMLHIFSFTNPHITHRSSVIISHIFSSSNNPVELVLSLNSSLTTS